MAPKIATAVEIVDGISFRLRTDNIVILDGVTAPVKNSEKDKLAIAKLAELILKKKCIIENHVNADGRTFDAFGRSNSQVNLEDGTDINKAMKEFLEKLG